jgi:hypothetical protein
MCSKQLFIYNMQGITRDNNFPLIQFDTDIDLYAFVTRLKSEPRNRDTTAPYFVINNTQLLPTYIRNMHVYRKRKLHTIKTYDVSDTENETDSDDEYDTFDGIFPIRDNLDELRRCTIDNNTNYTTGFAEAIRDFV